MDKQIPLPTKMNPALVAIDELLGLSGKGMKKRKKDTLIPGEIDEIHHYEEGIQKMLDIISPAGLDVTPKELTLNDLVTRTLFVYNWPNYIFPNWLSQLI